MTNRATGGTSKTQGGECPKHCVYKKQQEKKVGEEPSVNSSLSAFIMGGY